MNQEAKGIYEYSYLINRGILCLNQEFKDGPIGEITYDFNCKEYQELKKKYHLLRIAGKGSDFERARNLLKYFAPKLTHASYFDNHIASNSLALLEYSFKNPEQGINCISKAKIFAEICLAIGIKARRIFILPYSPYDVDSHVVSEIYDNQLNKWIMMDPTTNGYFINDQFLPLSMLEIRDHFANNKPITYIKANEKSNDFSKLEEKSLEDNWYICKNSFRIYVEAYQGFGEKKTKKTYEIVPQNYSIKDTTIKNCEYRIETFKKEYPDFVDFFQKRLEKAKSEKEAKAYSYKTLL